ncbi:hypothetical protein QBC44DRAFT_162073 [Cladorrhinum sp. PSN332]|nr:hypothetical protein QBC44DRAFT_162073 [Cladorrhinum sp. PSN332]
MAKTRPPSLPSIPDLELDSFHMDMDTREENEKSQQLFTSAEYDLLEESTTSSSTILGDSSSSSTSFHRSNSQILPHRRSIPIRFASPAPSSSSTIITRLSYPPASTSTLQPLLYHQLPPPFSTSNPEVYESYTLTYHHPSPSSSSNPTSASSLLLCGLIPLYTRTTTQTEPGRVLSVVPNPHFSQQELYDVVQREYRTLFTARTGRPPSEYSADLERRLRGLEWKVQDEIMDLLNDRVGSSSSAYRRREWRAVVLVEVEGGDVVGEIREGGGQWEGPRDPEGRGGVGKWWKVLIKNNLNCGRITRRRIGGGGKVKKAPVTEYRLILRGKEVAGGTSGCEEGWRWYNRYSRPWRDVDEEEEKRRLGGQGQEQGVKRRWSGITRSSSASGFGGGIPGMGEKYVDF